MTMKLSEAIRMNGMMKPQGFGSESVFSAEAPCAIGGALQSIGRQHVEHYPDMENYERMKIAWPFTEKEVAYPCTCSDEVATAPVAQIIWHLNDRHRLSRAQIAEWVTQLEPREVDLPHSQDILTDGGPGPGERSLEATAS